MKKLTRFLVILLICIFAFSAFSCAEKDSYVIYVPDGAPALCMASFMKEGATLNGKKVEVYVSTGDTVKAKLLSGEADIAVLPVSAGAKLYHNGEDIKLCAVTVWGLNYLVGKTNISSLEDLKGEVVHSIGKGDTPDIMFRKILTEKDIPFEESDTPIEGKVAIKYYSAGSEIVPLLKNGNAEFAILGEPVASKTKAPAIGCVELCNLQTEWNTITNGASVAQAGVFLGKSVYGDTKLIVELITALKANDIYISENASEATDLLKAKDSAVASSTIFTADLIARCNIKTEKAQDKLSVIESYFAELKSFGALPALPDTGFYI